MVKVEVEVVGAEAIAFVDGVEVLFYGHLVVLYITKIGFSGDWK